MSHLVKKYNVPSPRYTSYPTVPYWDSRSYNTHKWKDSVLKCFKESHQDQGISLYIHLPFCENLCTFCGCHKRITKNHSVELPYLESVLKEFELYVHLFGQKPIIKQIHLGGGTPTFFSAENLKHFLTGIFKLSHKHDAIEFSFEGHPNNTTKNHLNTLKQLGFNRVCYGVQDYNTKVQKAINRIQPFQKVVEAHYNAKICGYESIGHDLVYGLPFQTLDDVVYTISKTISLRPDRIAYYSYAHVPWVKGNGQRGFKDQDLPKPKQKQEQYEVGRKMLIDAGYVEIGMDHFALPQDQLSQAKQDGTIHRNFMGYTASKTKLLIGLGVSSISDSWYGFSQNVKTVEDYQLLVQQSKFPLLRGHILTDEDLIVRQHILNLMCTFKTSWKSDALYFKELPQVLIRLLEMICDDLVIVDADSIEVTQKGRPFVRNVCVSFDLRLQRQQPETRIFSMSV